MQVSLWWPRRDEDREVTDPEKNWKNSGQLQCGEHKVSRHLFYRSSAIGYTKLCVVIMLQVF